VKWWRWIVLIFELFLFVLILVLPQVDLPDLAFHRGSAPVVAKSRITSPPILALVAVPNDAERHQSFDGTYLRHVRSPFHARSHSLLSLLCTLLC
jgi:hypothetical protein